MRTKLIQIGNSRGIRIPKPIIEESGLTEEVEMILRDEEIILRPVKEVRKNWDESFKRMAEKEDDVLLDQSEIEQPSAWDEKEWTW